MSRGKAGQEIGGILDEEAVGEGLPPGVLVYKLNGPGLLYEFRELTEGGSPVRLAKLHLDEMRGAIIPGDSEIKFLSVLCP